jgi:hypothetical protein
VLVGDGRGSLERLGRSIQQRRQVFGVLLYDAPCPLSGACRAIGWARIHELRPLTFQVGAVALIVCHLALKFSLLVFALLIPERGRAVVVLRRLLMPHSGLSVVF